MPDTIKLVLLRHGESTWNLENRFTGWVDVGLSEKGIAETKTAVDYLKEEGLVFDVAHTSMLRRALLTLHNVLDGLDLLWIPVKKHWRLNERHYGALQGLNKKETSEKHGSDKVHLWRRSYDVPPPPLSEQDPLHPKHDPRYCDLAPDILPASECLADVVDRMLPYWHDSIVPDLRAGKRVLIAAHGNSLRALVKHLDKVSDSDIPALNIPTGIPLLYELDADLRPIASRYLGDPEAARKAAEAVAKQSQV